MGALMNRLIHFAIAAGLAAMSAVPASAALTLVGVYSGNDCEGSSFQNCYATLSGINNPQGASPSYAVIKFNGNQQDQSIPPLGLDEVSSRFGTVTGGEFTRAFNATTNVFSFTYNPGAGDPTLHYIAVKQATQYALYYSAAPILAGSIDLDVAFSRNTDDFSHVTFFNSTAPIPEPGTWAMMILGFGAVGGAMRSARKRRTALTFV
jgi:hypothetical protein